MEKKYKFTGEQKKWNGTILHRIEAVRDFGNVKKGDKGGWIETEDNLSQNGNCWIFKGVVTGFATIIGDAKVTGGEVTDFAIIADNAVVTYCKISDFAVIADNAVAYRAKIGDNSKVTGCAFVDCCAEIRGKSRIFGSAQIGAFAKIEDLSVCDNALVSDSAMVSNGSRICGEAIGADGAVIRGKYLRGRQVYRRLCKRLYSLLGTNIASKQRE